MNPPVVANVGKRTHSPSPQNYYPKPNTSQAYPLPPQPQSKYCALTPFSRQNIAICLWYTSWMKINYLLTFLPTILWMISVFHFVCLYILVHFCLNFCNLLSLIVYFIYDYILYLFLPIIFPSFLEKKNRWKSYNLYMNEPKTHKKTNKTIQKWRRADEARVKWPVPFCGTVSWYFCYSLFLQISLFFLSLFSELLIVSSSPPPPHHHHNLFSILFFPACNHPFFQFCGIFIIIGEIYPFSIHFCCRLIRTLTMT